MIEDFALIAALAAVVAAGVAGWAGRHAVITLVIAAGLMALNLVLSWNSDDPAGTTVEGMIAAFGMMISVSLFVLALVVALLAWAARRVLRA